MVLERPSPHDYAKGGCDGYSGGCHVCAQHFLDDLESYRAEAVSAVDIRWAKRKIAEATKLLPKISATGSMPRMEPVPRVFVQTTVSDDGEVVVTRTETFDYRFGLMRRRAA